MVNFALPTVGPSNDEEELNYNRLGKLIKESYFSSVVGWLIEEMAGLENDDAKIKYIKKEIQQHLGSGFSRVSQSWALVAYFALQVCTPGS